MATAFETRFKNRAAPRLMNRHAEPLTYRPSPSGPGDRNPRPISGMVDRGPPAQLGEGVAESPSFRIEVYDDPVTGIEAKTIDRGNDRIDVPELPNRPARTMTIMNVTNSEGGLLTLEVR